MGLMGGSDTRVNATFTAKDQASPTVKKLRDELKLLGSKTGGPLGGLLGGLGSLNTGALLAGGAVAGLGGFMASAAKAAIDDQQNVDHLSASLKANVPNWQASKSAIDDFITSGQALAFSDDDIRDSIAGLVARTHDVNKALALTREAMDLARFKGMSLAEASAALGKVFDGKVTAGAKAAGIAIDKTATSTQALAQIQLAATGQADKYASSTEGTLDRVADKWGEAIESIGYDLLPAIQGIGDALIKGIDLLGNFGTAFDNLHRAIDPAYSLLEDTDAAIRKLAESRGLDGDAAVEWAHKKKAAAEASAAAEQANTDALIATALATDLAANKQSNYDDIAKQYGATAADVIRVQGEFVNGVYKGTEAQQENAQVTSDAAAAVGGYASSLDEASDSVGRHTVAVNDMSDGVGRHTQAMAVDVRGFAAFVTNEDRMVVAWALGQIKAAQDAAAGWDAASRAISTAAQTARDKATTYLGEIPVFGSQRLRDGLDLIKAAMAAYKLAITEPVTKAKELSAIQAELTSKKLRRNLHSKNPQIRADTKTLVDWLIAERNRLNGTVIFTGQVVAGATNYIGPGGQGQTGDVIPSGPGMPPPRHHNNHNGNGHNGNGHGNNHNGNHNNGVTEIHTHLYVDSKEIAHSVDRHLGMGWAIAGSSRTRN